MRSSANSVKTSQTSPQLSAPSTTPLVQQTLLAGKHSLVYISWAFSLAVKTVAFEFVFCLMHSDFENKLHVREAPSCAYLFIFHVYTEN